MERCIPPYPTADTRGASRPRPRRGIIRWAEGSREAQLAGETPPVGGGYDAFAHQGSEGSQNLGPAAVDAPVAQLADHSGEAVLVFIGIECAVRALTAQLPELFRDPRGRDGLERALLLVSRHVVPSPKP